MKILNQHFLKIKLSASAVVNINPKEKGKKESAFRGAV
jgi:hypothetical protein